MELKVQEFNSPAAILFNFEELKTEITEKMEHYTNLVYTDDQISDAKADRAKLRKFVEILDGRRKEIKTEVMKPYMDFEQKLNEIKALVNEPIALIDNQVKTYEAKKREEKRSAILEVWDSKEVPEGLEIGLIWDEKWLNVTVSLKSIEETMDQQIGKFKEDLATIEGLPDHQYEAREEYIATLDLGRAVKRAQFLREQDARKAEYYAEQERLKAEQEAKALMNAVPEAKPATTELSPELKESRQWKRFELYLTKEETEELCRWINEKNIAIRAAK